MPDTGGCPDLEQVGMLSAIHGRPGDNNEDEAKTAGLARELRESKIAGVTPIHGRFAVSRHGQSMHAG